MDMLSDVEDTSARLKILKSLMKNIVTDPDIITELDEQIELAIAEKEPAEEPDQHETDLEGDNDVFSLDDETEYTIDKDESPNNDDSKDTEESDSDIYDNITIDKEDKSETSHDTILPSPDQLGIDLVNSD